VKHLKIFSAALTLAVIAIAFSSFVADRYHSKAFATRCFSYTGPTSTGHPTGSDVTTSSNYAEITGEPNCPAPRQVLCGICYNEGTGVDQYPVNASNQPDFAGSAALTSEVSSNGLNPLNHGVTIKGIKYFFKPRPGA